MSRSYVLALLILPLALACAGRPESAPTPAARPSVARPSVARPPEVTDSAMRLGEAVFNGRGNCHHCHGDDGRGGPLGPSLADSVWVSGDGSYLSLVELVVHGVPIPRDSTRLPMPERRVADLRYAEISAVAAYVWSLRERR